MPFFDFKCECGARVENKLVKKAEDPVECPECQTTMQKCVAAPNFKFGKSMFVKKPTKAEQKSSEGIMNDYHERAKGTKS